MDPRESIRKLNGKYVDWYGQPATEAQYLDYTRRIGQNEVSLELQSRAETQIAKFEEKRLELEPDPEITSNFTDEIDSAMFSTPIAELDIPYQSKLLDHFGDHATISDIYTTKADLVTYVPGVGQVAADRIAVWLHDNLAIEIK